MPVTVALSYVSDGSMYNRNDMFDANVITARKAFLKNQNITIDQTTRLKVVFERDDYCRYVEIDESTKGDGIQDNNGPIVDAIITRNTHHALFLPVADCVGAVLYDPEHNILALAHLGRHSLEQLGAQKIVEHLAETYASNPASLKVWLTAAAGKDVYQIWKLDNKGMKEATFEQLLQAGIAPDNIIDDPADTTSNKAYYSYSEYLKGHRPVDGDHAIVAMMTD